MSHRSSRRRSICSSPLVLVLAAALAGLVAAGCGDDPAAPVACDPLPQLTVNAGEESSVAVCFTDANGDMLSYTATSSNPAVATASITGTSITVTGVAPGTTTVTVTAEDTGGLQAEVSFAVMIPNRAPQPLGTVPSDTVEVGETATVDASQYFSEPDGEELAYAASASDVAVASVSVARSTITVTAESKGSATITITASDPGGLSAQQSFVVTVPNRAPVVTEEFSDAELFVGDTLAVDLAEYFADPDGDILLYEAETSAPAAAAVAVDGGGLTVTALAQGEATVTVTARDSEGRAASQDFVVSVPNRAPVVTEELSDAELFVGDTLVVDLAEYFADPDGDVLLYEAETSAPAAAAVAVDGSGLTVAALAQGEATVTVTARDSEGLSASQDFVVSVPNRAPVVTEELSDTELFVGDTLAVDLAGYFADPDGDVLQYEAETSAPAAAAVAVDGGGLTVTALAQGEVTVTVTARDSEGLSASQDFVVTVPNRAPVVTEELSDAELFVGDSLAVDLAEYFEDPDGDVLLYEAETSAPAAAAVAVDGGGLTVTALAQGEATVTVTARDSGGLSASQDFVVSVPNRAPVVTEELSDAELFVGDSLAVDLAGYFADPDGDVLQYEAETSAPAAAAVAVSGGGLTVTVLAQGEATVTVTARDSGGLSASQDFVVSVPNRAPVVTEELSDAELFVGDSLAVDLAGYFADPDGDVLQYEAETSAPTAAAVAVDGGGLTVTALAQGEATVTVTARDSGGLAASQDFVVSVPNRAPVVTEELSDAELFVGDSLAVDLAGYFADPDGDVLQYEAETSAPTAAAVAVDGGGLTVTALAQGEATVTVTARDSGGRAASQDFVVTVPNRAPVVTEELSDAELFVGDSLAVDLAEYFEDPDGDVILYEAETSAPAAAAVAVDGGGLTVTALAQGEVTVTVTARDSEGLSASQDFVVTVPNRAPVVTEELSDAELFVGDSLAVDLAEYFEDPDGDVLLYEAETSAPAAAAVAVDGSGLTVAALAQGEATVTVTARDSEGLSGSQDFVVSVPNRAPVVTEELSDAELVVGDTLVGDLAEYFEDPDGDVLLYEAETSAPAAAAVAVDGGGLTVTALAQGEATVTVTARDSGGLSASQDFVVSVAPALTRLTNNPAWDDRPAWSPDGTRIAFSSQRDEGAWEIYVMDADGSDVERLTSNTAWDYYIAWSPGTRIAFSSYRDGSGEIYAMDADGSDVERLTNHGAPDIEPAWSPDGTRIAFSSLRDGNYEIYAMDADGSDMERLTNHGAPDIEPAWSPDGTRIAFQSRRDGNEEIYVMDADGSDVERLTNHTAGDDRPAWSPDGTRIAFQSTRDGNYEIYVMNADGSDVERLTNNGASLPAWSPDSARTRIAFTSNRDGNTEIYVKTLPTRIHIK